MRIQRPTITQITQLKGDGAILTGSFSGSFTGEYNTDIVSSSAQIAALGAGIISSSTQIDTDLFDIDNLVSSSAQTIANLPAGTISGSAQLPSGTVSSSLQVSGEVGGHIIPTTNNTFDLGSPTKTWRDLYLSSASLYINGNQIISTDGTELRFTSDDGESVKFIETNSDTFGIQTADGDITFTTTGTGNIELDATVQVGAGNNIISSDGNAIVFGDNVSLGSNNFDAAAITTTGNINIGGDLVVTGTTTELQVTNLNVEDKNILIASGAADAPAANGAGLTVDGASATLTYASTGDKWVFNKDLDLGSNDLITSGNVDGVDISAFSSSVETRIDSKLNTSDALVNLGGFNQLTFKDAAGRINGSSELTLDSFGAGLTLTSLASLDGGIDVNGSLFTVDVAGDTKADSLGVGTAASGTTGEIRATGDITAYYSSDERLKENFAPLTGALDKVKAIGGYEFDWKDGIEDVVSKTGHDIGVKAQELQAQYPELVHERDNGYLAVDYIKLNAVLIEAVKELAAKVEELSK
jgi:hypothetical protein